MNQGHNIAGSSTWWSSRPRPAAVADRGLHLPRACCATYHQFGWWEDLNPTSLHPAHPNDVARELRAAITDPEAVLARARALRDAGDIQLALHVIDLLALGEAGSAADPAVTEAKQLKAELCRLAALANPSYVTQSLYLNGADLLDTATGKAG
jgi:alkyl sulfatase BDS1-like metallo-beta-lactamase superfamily hydrolase